MKYTQGWKWKNVTLSVGGPRRRQPRSVKRHLSKIFLTFFSIVFPIGRGRSSGIRKSGLHLGSLLITIQPVLCIADNLKSPRGFKKINKINHIPRLLPPMNLKLGFKTFCGTWGGFPWAAIVAALASDCSFWTLFRSRRGTRDLAPWLTPSAGHPSEKPPKKGKKRNNFMPFKKQSTPGLVYRFKQELHGVLLQSLPVDYNCPSRCLDLSLRISKRALHYLFWRL